MVHQKTLTFFGVEVPDSLQGSLTELGHDVLTLADLQARLAQADLNETVREARGPAVGLIVGLVVLVCSVPIALVGLAELIIWAELLPRFGAYLAVAGGAALLAGLTAWLCLRSLLRSGRAFDRSRQELRRNLHWLTKVVSESGNLRLRQPQHWSRFR
jgi:uncharacterized membrane protein YqjE